MLKAYKQMLANYADKLQTYTYPKVAKKKPGEIKPSDLKPQPVLPRTPVEKVLAIPEVLPDIVEVAPVATGQVSVAITPAEQFEKDLMNSLRSAFQEAIQRYRDKHSGQHPPIYTEAFDVIDKGGKMCQRGFTATQCAALKDPDLHLIHSAYLNLKIMENRIEMLKSGKVRPNKLWEYRILGRKAPYET